MVSQATELLVGLWLRGLKQPKCAKTVGEWRRALISRGGAANDNITPSEREARVRALLLLDRACEECTRACPLRPPMPARALVI